MGIIEEKVQEELLRQWFVLHKTPEERWKQECKELEAFNTFEEYCSFLSVRYFGEDVFSREWQNPGFKTKVKRLRSKVWMQFRSKSLSGYRGK